MEVVEGLRISGTEKKGWDPQGSLPELVWLSQLVLVLRKVIKFFLRVSKNL